jgi:uncharacterized membrane protein
MNIPQGMLSEAWLLTALGTYLFVWVAVLRTTPWRRLLDNSLSHAFFGACVLLLVLWHITTRQMPGLNYHYLGAALVTLMFRWQLAFVAMNLILLAMCLSGDGQWQTLPINALTMGLIPILTSYGLYRLVEAKLPNHLFIYLFINAFFGAALAIGVAVSVSALLLVSAGVYPLDYLLREYFPFLPLMMFPEAFITGMLTTLAVVFYPQWVLTFDDVKYLNK